MKFTFNEGTIDFDRVNMENGDTLFFGDITDLINAKAGILPGVLTFKSNGKKYTLSYSKAKNEEALQAFQYMQLPLEERIKIDPERSKKALQEEKKQAEQHRLGLEARKEEDEKIVIPLAVDFFKQQINSNNEQKYEYTVAKISDGFWSESIDPNKLANLLNGYAAQGWRVVSMVPMKTLTLGIGRTSDKEEIIITFERLTR